jgi:ATP-dependent protease ClpP protease subunit
MPAKTVPFPVGDVAPSFSIRAEAGGKGVIDIRGTIGLEKYFAEEYGMDAGGTVSDFDHELKELGPVSELEVNIYSLGGDVLTALGIQSILTRHPARVVANVDGIAASAATIILMAADEIRMPENAYLMIHNATMCGCGDYREMATLADNLKKWSRDMANLYSARIEDNLGGERAAILADVIRKMDAETWMTGAEAKAMGLIETVTGRVELAACAVPAPLRMSLTSERIPDAVKALLIDRPTVSMSTELAEAPAEEITETVEAKADTVPASDESDKADTADVSVTAEVPAVAPAAETPAAPEALTLEKITAAMSGVIENAVKPIAERLEKAEAALANEQALRANKVPVNAWGNQQPADTAQPAADAGDEPEYRTLTAQQKFELGCKKMHPAFFGK